jgi:hypothetical protein
MAKIKSRHNSDSFILYVPSYDTLKKKSFHWGSVSHNRRDMAAGSQRFQVANFWSSAVELFYDETVHLLTLST